MDLPILDISPTWMHPTCGLLCLGFLRSIMVPRLTHAVACVFHFVCLNNTPLCKYAAFCLSVRSLMDLWILLPFGSYEYCSYKHSWGIYYWPGPMPNGKVNNKYSPWPQVVYNQVEKICNRLKYYISFWLQFPVNMTWQEAVRWSSKEIMCVKW